MPMTINGTGSITGLSAGGLPDATIAQADLAPNVAGNGPCFSAYQSVATSVVNGGSGTKCVCNVESFDSAGAYDTTTGRFTPQVAGYYYISGSTDFADAPITLSAAQAVIAKNGEDINAKVSRSTTGGTSVYIACFTSALVYLNGTTDYVVLVAYQNQGSSRSTATGIGATTFSGALVRSA